MAYFYGSTTHPHNPVEASENIVKVENPTKKNPIYHIAATPFAQNVDRIGINLGSNNPDKSESLTKNILMNPGFEGEIDRIIVIVSRSDQKSFSDDKGWGYQDDYWKDAEFEIRSGEYVGYKGTLQHSLREGANGFPQYFSEKPLPTLENKTIILLNKVVSQDKIPHWTVVGEKVALDSSEHRPGSEGLNALLLQPSNQSVTLKTHPGKLSQLHGNWVFSIWLKGNENQEISIDFSRKHRPETFLSQTIHPTPFWKKYSFEFTPHAQESFKPLTLKIKVSGQGKLWIDDLWLGPKQNSAETFRSEVVTALKKLQPSYLRESPFVGGNLENRLATPFARKSWVLHTAGSSGRDTYSYSLEDFLNLCKNVHANPWIVVPPTFTDQEYRDLGKFLGENAPAHIFSNVILEFGQENWNWTNRPTGIPYPKIHGILADRAFEFILLGAKTPSHFTKTVNGQYLDPALSMEYLENTSMADALTLAPYFFSTLDAETPYQKTLQNLFQNNSENLALAVQASNKLDKKLSIYGMNLNTLEGNAAGDQRNEFISGAVSGTALAKHILEAIKNGANPIMVSNLAQLETETWDSKDKVKLWGIVRRFSPELILRPTGLAVMMLNRICGGDGYSVEEETSPLTVLAFTPEQQWTAAIASGSESPVSAELVFPDDNKPLPERMLILDFQSPFAANEENEMVKLNTDSVKINNRTVSFTVPPYGFVVLGSQKQTEVLSHQNEKNVAPMEDAKNQLKQRLETFRQKRRALERALKANL